MYLGYCVLEVRGNSNARAREEQLLRKSIGIKHCNISSGRKGGCAVAHAEVSSIHHPSPKKIFNEPNLRDFYKEILVVSRSRSAF